MNIYLRLGVVLFLLSILNAYTVQAEDMVVIICALLGIYTSDKFVEWIENL